MFAEVDLRSEPIARSHERVCAAFATLRVGEAVRVVVDHEPRPLRLCLNDRFPGNYVWTQRFLGESSWEAWIRRTEFGLNTRSDHETVLSCSPLSAEISDRDRRLLLSDAVYKKIRAHEAVVEQGVCWPSMGVVISGTITATVGTETGRDYVLFEALPGDWFGELQALDGGVTIARFVAETGDSEVLLVPRTRIRTLAARDPRFASQLALMTAQRARLLSDLLYARVVKPTISRLAAAILPYATQPHGLAEAIPSLQSVTQIQLARTVGTAKEVVARDLAELKSAGAVRLQRGRVVAIDEARLRRFL